MPLMSMSLAIALHVETWRGGEEVGAAKNLGEFAEVAYGPSSRSIARRNSSILDVVDPVNVYCALPAACSRVLHGGEQVGKEELPQLVAISHGRTVSERTEK